MYALSKHEKFPVLRHLSRCYSPHFILTAARFPEVRDGGELCVDGLAVEPTVVQVHDCFLSVLLTTELHNEDNH